MKRPLLTITVPFRSTWFLIPFGILLTFFLVRGEGTIHYTQVLTCAAASLVVGVISGILSAQNRRNLDYATLGKEVLKEADFWGLTIQEFYEKGTLLMIMVSNLEKMGGGIYVEGGRKGSTRPFNVFLPPAIRENLDD